MPRQQSLLRERDFLHLWGAQTVSDFGARIGREGLPILAVLSLAAGPGALGVLAAVRGGAALMVGLTAGGFVDGRRRRPVMIAADIGRAAVLATLPLAAWLHVLAMPLVLVVVALVSAMSTVFDIANHAYLPTLVSRERVTEANSRTSATEGLAEMAGPALAGVLFQWLTAPIAVIVNAATYILSAIALARIRAPEPPLAAHARDTGMLTGLQAGARAIHSHPVVRVLMYTTVVNGLFGGVFSALYVLFVLRGLGLGPVILGLGIACGGFAGLLGSFAAGWFARRLGVGPAIIVTGAISACGTFVLLLAPRDPAGAVTCLVIQQITGDFFGVVPFILGPSLVQSSFPSGMLGRVRAVFQAFAGFAGILGALAGGACGVAFGSRHAMMGAVAGLLIGPVIAAFSPLAKTREMPST